MSYQAWLQEQVVEYYCCNAKNPAISPTMTEVRYGAINIARRLIIFIPRLRDENQGLGRWLLPHEKSTLKARRSSRSKGKSSPSRSLSGSKGRSAADCSTQMALEPFLSSTDPAVERTVEKPSAAINARKASDSHGVAKQRSEAQSQQRSYASLKLSKARLHALGAVSVLVGDSRREKGETRKLKALEGVHSPFND